MWSISGSLFYRFQCGCFWRSPASGKLQKSFAELSATQTATTVFLISTTIHAATALTISDASLVTSLVRSKAHVFSGRSTSQVISVWQIRT